MKKGFTLIELLAVIAILSILVVVAVPTVLKMLKSAKLNVFTTEMKNLVRASDMSYGKTVLNTNTVEDTTYEFVSGEMNMTDGNIELNFSGNNKYQGEVTITKEGKVVINIYNGEFCAVKEVTDNEVYVSETTLELCLPQEEPEIPEEEPEELPPTPEVCFKTNMSDAPSAAYLVLYNAISRATLNASPSLAAENGYINPATLASNETIIYNYDINNPLCTTTVVIPETINGKNVVGIGGYAFTNGIGEGKGIVEVHLSDTIRALAFAAFADNLITEVDLKNVELIGKSAFGTCILENVIFSNEVKEIAFHAFYGNQLSSVTIPSSQLTKIGEAAFSYNPIIQGNTRICINSSGVSINSIAFSNTGPTESSTTTPVFTADVCD